MKAVRDLGERFWSERQAERAQCLRRCQHSETLRLVAPERVHLAWLPVLQLADMILFLDVVRVSAGQMIEPLLQGREPALVETRLVQLGKRCFSDVLERNAIGARLMGERRR